MAQGISNTNANAMLAAMSSYALFIGLNQSNPGITGAGEISANSYDRQPASWQAPNSGQLKAMAAGIPMRVPGNSSPGFWSLWTQKSLGVFAGAGSFGTAEIFINPGTLTVKSLAYSLDLVAAAGGGGGTAPTLHTFTLVNDSGAATTTPMARLGLAFVAGDVPSGSRLKVRRQDTQADVAFAAAAGRNTWADGSLRSTADGGMVMADSSPIAAGASRTYEVYAASGAQGASSFNPWTWLAGHANDWTVAVTARSGGSDTTNLLFALKTALATTTRREILCDTERFVRVKCWQKAPSEEHLICEFHLDFWLDVDKATVLAVEFAPVLTQHWWVANPFGVTQTKTDQTYTATVKYGTGTTLDTRAALVHSYYCRWASLRTANDPQHARKHWINIAATPLPTVRVQYSNASLKKSMKAGAIPPLKLGVNYTPVDTGYNYIHAPLGQGPDVYDINYPHGHRAGINSTGAYEGRGMWGDFDSKLIGGHQGSATAATAISGWRQARCAAQAGLSVFFHVFDHRSSAGINGGTDVSNRLIPQSFRQAAVLGISESYSGLAAHCVYSEQGVNESVGLNLLGAEDQTAGYTGAFGGYDPSHAVNYCGPMAFLEGEAYLGDAAMSAHRKSTAYYTFNRIGQDTGLYYSDYPVRQAAQGIPTGSYTGWGTIPDMGVQERAFAWSMNNLWQAYVLRADAHPEQPFLKNMVRNCDRYLSESFGYYPTGTGSHYARGGAYLGVYYRWISPWMCHWQGLACYNLARLTTDFLPDNARSKTGIEEAAFLSARLALGQMRSHPYASGSYHAIFATDEDGLAPVPLNEWPENFPASITGNVWTATCSPGMNWTNGDKVRVPTRGASFTVQTLPTGVTAGTLYYMVNVSGSTFKLSLTPGGSAISAGDIGNVEIGITPACYQITPLSHSYYWPGDDSYELITSALCETAIGNGHSDIAGGEAAAIRAHYAPKVAEVATYGSWVYDGANLL